MSAVRHAEAVLNGTMRHTRTTMSLSDTSQAAREFYYRRLAEMHPSERVRMGVLLWEIGNALQRAALKSRYPDADDTEIAFHMAVARFGSDLARRAWRRD